MMMATATVCVGGDDGGDGDDDGDSDDDSGGDGDGDDGVTLMVLDCGD